MDKAIADILECAKQLLKTSAANGFSMGKVAQACDIPLNELQRHFKTSSLLLTALATSLLESYCLYFNGCEIDKGSHLQANLQQWLVNLLKHRESEESDALFKALWAIALHDQEMRLLLDQYYRQLQHIMADKLQTIAPEGCTEQCITSASCFLLPFIEGYSIMRSPLPSSLLLLAEQLSQSLMAILLQE